MAHKNKPKVPLLPPKPLLASTLSNSKAKPPLLSIKPAGKPEPPHASLKPTLSAYLRPELPAKPKPSDRPELLAKPKPSDRPNVPSRPPPTPHQVNFRKLDHTKHVSNADYRNTFSPELSLTKEFFDEKFGQNNNGTLDINANGKIKPKKNPLPPRPPTSNLNKHKSLSAPNLFITDMLRPHSQSLIVEDTIYEDEDQCDGNPKTRLKEFAAKTRTNRNKIKNVAKSGFQKGIKKWHSFADQHTRHLNKEDTFDMPKSWEIEEAKESAPQIDRYSEINIDSDAPLFEFVLVMTLKEISGKLTPVISFQFPPTFNKDKIDHKMQSIPQFCFPDTSISYKHGETFSFVLTSDSGERRYGFCRMINSHSMKQPEVYCIVSPHGLFSLYSQILEEVENQRQFSSTAVFSFLKATLSRQLPKPSESVNVSFFSSGSREAVKEIILTRPGDSVIHEHVKLKLLFDTLKTDVILELLTCLLIESKVILCSKSLSLLTSCCHALISLMYPFDWEHTYIPVIPRALVDIVCLPTPYLLGILPSSLPEVEDLPIEEVYIINLDSGNVVLKPPSKCVIPKEQREEVKQSLETIFELSRSGTAMQDGEEKAQNEIISEVFIQMYIQLVGNFEHFYTKDENKIPIINYKPFYKSAANREQKHFLKDFILTQAFQKFSSSRKSNGPSHALFESRFTEWKNSKSDQTGHFKKNIDSLLTTFKKKFRK